ncbi:MAG: hypothetical protein IJE28_09400, partial [Oscillospiraceae bacterium]|nr:hypothetical protein [Oscillospiraceae bacterium]
GICEANDGGIVIPSHQIQPPICKRIPPVLAKPKPPPFNKGGFQQKRADNIRSCGYCGWFTNPKKFIFSPF